MIDYWEAIGRLASDKKLADGLFAILPKPAEFPCVATTWNGQATMGLDIPGPLYEKVQTYLEPHLGGQLLSMAAAGEIIWACSYPKFRQYFKVLNRNIAAAEPKVFSPPSSYFVALGLLLDDETFRQKFRQGDSKVLARLGHLPAPHVKNLHSFVNTSNFEKSIKTFDDIWIDGCHALLLPKPGDLYGPGVRKQKKGKAAGAGY